MYLAATMSRCHTIEKFCGSCSGVHRSIVTFSDTSYIQNGSALAADSGVAFVLITKSQILSIKNDKTPKEWRILSDNKIIIIC